MSTPHNFFGGKRCYKCLRKVPTKEFNNEQGVCFSCSTSKNWKRIQSDKWMFNQDMEVK